MWLRQSVLQFILMSPNNNISSRLWMFCQSINGFIGCLHLFLAIFNLSLLNICCYHTAVMWHSSVNVNDCSFTRRQDQSGHDGKWSLVLFLYRWMSHTEFSTFLFEVWSVYSKLCFLLCQLSYYVDVMLHGGELFLLKCTTASLRFKGSAKPLVIPDRWGIEVSKAVFYCRFK